MAGQEPSPQTTLLILLGASHWPDDSDLSSSTAFANAVRELRAYFLSDPNGFHLPESNALDLFDSNVSSPDILKQISDFLKGRIQRAKGSSVQVRDVLVYYVGHGGITSDSSIFYLAIRHTQKEYEKATSIAIDDLAERLKKEARFQRRILILDCCFAARAVKFLQGPASEVLFREKIIIPLQEKDRGEGFPSRGTSFLGSSGKDVASVILEDETSTKFTSALLSALRTGDPFQKGERLPLHTVYRLTIDFLSETYGDDFPRPELHSPDQTEGKVEDIPFFPNPWVEKERRRRIEEERRSLAEEEAHRAEEEQQRAEEERRLQAEGEARKKAEQDRRRRPEEEEKALRAEEEQQKDPHSFSRFELLLFPEKAESLKPHQGPSPSSPSSDPPATRGAEMLAPRIPLGRGGGLGRSVPTPYLGSQSVTLPPQGWADVLRRVREGTLPPTWRELPAKTPVILYALTGFLVGFFGSAVVVAIADLIPFIHNFFVQTPTNLALGNFLVWPALLLFPGGVGAFLGENIARKRQMSFVLVLLPDALVCGRKDKERASLALDFHYVVAMNVLPFEEQGLGERIFLNTALVLTLRQHDGKLLTMRERIPTDSESLRSIVAAYERFKTSSSV